MSTFVELPPGQYNRAAFAAFDPAVASFKIENARAMMWLSQLAYETGKKQTIEQIGPLWGFTTVAPFTKHKIDVTASFDTCGIIGERPDAVILAFAGTDPAVWETLATDFNIRPRPDTNTHAGFQAALDSARAEIEQAIQRSRQANKPLFIAGHSLGGALAALAAQFAESAGAAPRAVYVFGMPRTGGESFQAAYNTKLGAVTFRLVHGLDVVARVPMSGIGFRHVGRVLQCQEGEKFNSAALSAGVSDEPEFSLGLAQTLISRVEGFLSGHVFSPPGPGTFGPLFKFLPRPIRDHLQDCYYNALT
jgi:triacylglycerol lipase